MSIFRLVCVFLTLGATEAVRARAFHATLRQTFYPLLFAEATVTPADYATFPPFDPAVPRPTSRPSLWPLRRFAAASLGLALFTLQRSPTL